MSPTFAASMFFTGHRYTLEIFFFTRLAYSLPPPCMGMSQLSTFEDRNPTMYVMDLLTTGMAVHKNAKKKTAKYSVNG